MSVGISTTLQTAAKRLASFDKISAVRRACHECPVELPLCVQLMSEIFGTPDVSFSTSAHSERLSNVLEVRTVWTLLMNLVRPSGSNWSRKLRFLGRRYCRNLSHRTRPNQGTIRLEER